MSRSLVVGNWKMQGTSASIQPLLEGLKSQLESGGAVAVCPPFPYLPLVAGLLDGTGISWGAQNVCSQPQGAVTGEVAADMLADLGCRYVIIGHSERRALFAEDDQLLAEKFVIAQQQGLTPILCVGESLEQREAGETLAWISGQLQAVIDVVGIQAFEKAVVAYEPIWAIGTGKTASPEQAQEVHAHIRRLFAGAGVGVSEDAGNGDAAAIAANLSLLYGGSVNAANAEALFAQSDIDGGLVGGAALKVDEFIAVCRAAG